MRENATLSVSQNFVLRHGNRFVRSRLMPKSSAFRHSRIYRRKIRGACPRIFRIFIEIGLRPKKLIDFCNSLSRRFFSKRRLLQVFCKSLIRSIRRFPSLRKAALCCPCQKERPLRYRRFRGQALIVQKRLRRHMLPHRYKRPCICRRRQKRQG